MGDVCRGLVKDEDSVDRLDKVPSSAAPVPELGSI